MRHRVDRILPPRRVVLVTVVEKISVAPRVKVCGFEEETIDGMEGKKSIEGSENDIRGVEESYEENVVLVEGNGCLGVLGDCKESNLMACEEGLTAWELTRSTSSIASVMSSRDFCTLLDMSLEISCGWTGGISHPASSASTGLCIKGSCTDRPFQGLEIYVQSRS